MKPESLAPKLMISNVNGTGDCYPEHLGFELNASVPETGYILAFAEGA